MISLNQQVLKCVIQFDSAKSLSIVRNFLLNTTLPKIIAALENRVKNNFTNRIIKTKFKISKNGNTFTVYPKLIFSGDTDLTKTQLENGIDVAYDDIKAIIRADALSQNVTSIKWHIHKFSGNVEETE